MKHYCLVERYALYQGGYRFWRSLMYPYPEFSDESVYNDNELYGGRIATVKDTNRNSNYSLKKLKIKKFL